MSRGQPHAAPPFAAVILAAGQGTRMRSRRAKVLHEVGGAPLLHHAMRAALAAGPERLAVVVGHGGQEVAASAQALHPQTRICTQAQQRGTGHAVLAAAPALEGFDGDLVVLFGDTPFIRPGTLAAIREARAQGADLVALGFEAAEPGRYGRLVTGPGRMLERIVEIGRASCRERVSFTV